MSLKNQIQEDMKNAMRAKDSARLSAIRLLTAAMKQKEVDERIELNDETIVQIIDKLIKQRKDSIEAYQKAERQDLADQEAFEIDVLKVYLPERLNAAAIQTMLETLFADLSQSLGRPPSSSDMGKIMGLAKPLFAGKADMAQVSASIKSLLNAAV